MRSGLDKEEMTVLDEVIDEYRLRSRDYDDVRIRIEEEVGRGEDRIVLYKVSLFKEDGDSFTCYVLYDAYEELVEGFYDYQDDHEAQRAFDSLVERYA